MIIIDILLIRTNDKSKEFHHKNDRVYLLEKKTV